MIGMSRQIQIDIQSSSSGDKLWKTNRTLEKEIRIEYILISNLEGKNTADVELPNCIQTK